MIEVLTGSAAVFGGIGGVAWWLRHDGLLRLTAGVVAVMHPDPGRRADALKVLRCTGIRRPAAWNHRERGSAEDRP